MNTNSVDLNRSTNHQHFDLPAWMSKVQAPVLHPPNEDSDEDSEEDAAGNAAKDDSDSDIELFVPRRAEIFPSKSSKRMKA